MYEGDNIITLGLILCAVAFIGLVSLDVLKQFLQLMRHIGPHQIATAIIASCTVATIFAAWLGLYRAVTKEAA